MQNAVYIYLNSAYTGVEISNDITIVITDNVIKIPILSFFRIATNNKNISIQTNSPILMNNFNIFTFENAQTYVRNVLFKFSFKTNFSIPWSLL